MESKILTPLLFSKLTLIHVNWKTKKHKSKLIERINEPCLSQLSNFLSSSSFCARTTICFHQSCTFRNRIRINPFFLLRYPLKLRKTKNERPKVRKHTHEYRHTNFLDSAILTYRKNNDNSSKIFPNLTSKQKNKSLLLLLSFWEFVLPKGGFLQQQQKLYSWKQNRESSHTDTLKHTLTSLWSVVDDDEAQSAGANRTKTTNKKQKKNRRIVFS